MRVALLVSFFAGLSAVNALPGKPAAKDNTDCTCTEKVKSTTTIYDRIKSVKTTVTAESTLDPKIIVSLRTLFFSTVQMYPGG